MRYTKLILLLCLLQLTNVDAGFISGFKKKIVDHTTRYKKKDINTGDLGHQKVKKFQPVVIRNPIRKLERKIGSFNDHRKEKYYQAKEEKRVKKRTDVLNKEIRDMTKEVDRLQQRPPNEENEQKIREKQEQIKQRHDELDQGVQYTKSKNQLKFEEKLRKKEEYDQQRQEIDRQWKADVDHYNLMRGKYNDEHGKFSHHLKNNRHLTENNIDHMKNLDKTYRKALIDTKESFDDLESKIEKHEQYKQKGLIYKMFHPKPTALLNDRLQYTNGKFQADNRQFLSNKQEYEQGMNGFLQTHNGQVKKGFQDHDYLMNEVPYISEKEKLHDKFFAHQNKMINAGADFGLTARKLGKKYHDEDRRRFNLEQQLKTYTENQEFNRNNSFIKRLFKRRKHKADQLQRRKAEQEEYNAKNGVYDQQLDIDNERTNHLKELNNHMDRVGNLPYLKPPKGYRDYKKEMREGYQSQSQSQDQTDDDDDYIGNDYDYTPLQRQPSFHRSSSIDSINSGYGASAGGAVGGAVGGVEENYLKTVRPPSYHEEGSLKHDRPPSYGSNPFLQGQYDDKLNPFSEGDEYDDKLNPFS